jgi:hypothetical protein
MELRNFNRRGVEEAAVILDQLRSGELAVVPTSFLENDEFSSTLGIDIERPRKNEIENRWQLGLWLYQRLHNTVDERLLLREPGIWTWIAFFLFDTISPLRGAGRKVSENAKYILSQGDYRKSYRHLISGPYFMIRAHIDRPFVLRGILATPPDSPGEFYEQLASRKQIVTSQGAMATAMKLYWDDAKQRSRRGAAGSGPGSARRFASVLMQYDVTFDLYALESEALISMLPKEFSKFLIAAS